MAVGGLHVRAGNAMARTQQRLLDGALDVASRRGLRAATMGEIAAAGGVAKATLYNHFRSKDDVWTALARREADRVSVALVGAAASDLAAALAAAGWAVATHPVLAQLRASEPETLVRLASATEGPVWCAGRDAVRAALVAADREAGDAAVGLVVRWIVAGVLQPGSRAACGAEAALLAAALPRAAARSVTLPGAVPETLPGALPGARPVVSVWDG